MSSVRLRGAIASLFTVLGCRIPAEPPPGFGDATAPPAAGEKAADGVGEGDTDGADRSTPRVDPFAAEARARERAAAERRAIEDPAACLMDFSRANGYGSPSPAMRAMKSACDRAGLPAEQCRPEHWLTREAAECLAVTRSMAAGAEVESDLGVDRARGLMVWTVRGELASGNSLRRWEVELRADSGAVLGVAQSIHMASGGQP